jgi:hypothetical protein
VFHVQQVSDYILATLYHCKVKRVLGLLTKDVQHHLGGEGFKAVGALAHILEVARDRYEGGRL